MAEGNKLEVIEGTKMEIILPQASREEAEELAEFLTDMTVAGQQDFLNFIRGANFAKRLLA